MYQECLLPFSHLGVGKYFGQLALEADNKGSKRAASVISMTDNCLVATLHRNDYQQTLTKNVERSNNEMINFLKSIPVFS